MSLKYFLFLEILKKKKKKRVKTYEIQDIKTIYIYIDRN